MIRRPPRSTLFPSRRSSDLGRPARRLSPQDPRAHHQPPRPRALRFLQLLRRKTRAGPRRSRAILLEQRSEEHTSELQSRQYIVCRLLLEKKKNTALILPSLS